MSGLPSDPSDDELVQRSLAGEVRAFAQLVEKHQRLVFGVALSGTREVATGLGISEELVRQRLSRGRRALHSSLELRIEGALEQLGPSKSFTATVVIACVNRCVPAHLYSVQFGPSTHDFLNIDVFQSTAI